MNDGGKWNMEPMDDRYDMLEILMKVLENIWCCMLMYVFLLSDEISVVIEIFFHQRISTSKTWFVHGGSWSKLWDNP